MEEKTTRLLKPVPVHVLVRLAIVPLRPRVPLPPLPSEPNLADAGVRSGAKLECHVHADCTQRPGGRCVVMRSDPPASEVTGSHCAYNQCIGDEDCADNGVCMCGNVTNVCLPGNCRRDSDCGGNLFCSPNIDSCLNDIKGYFCQTASDECVRDSDCDHTKFQMRCVYDPSVSHWTCPRTSCVH